MIACVTFWCYLIKITNICRWVVETKWEKKELIWQNLHVQVDEFSSLIRKPSGCRLKTGWSAKRLVLPGLNLCLVSFSAPQPLFTYSDIGSGLLADCLFHAVFHFFMQCDHLEEARQAVWILRAESVSSGFQRKPPVSPGPKNVFGWSLRTLPQMIKMSVKDARLSLCIALKGLYRWDASFPSPGCSLRQVSTENTRRCNKYFLFMRCCLVSQGYKSWASQRS